MDQTKTGGFTPGPWMAGCYNDRYDEWAVYPAYDTGYRSDDIAKGIRGKADACLIAHAPAMLDELLEVLVDVQASEDDNFDELRRRMYIVGRRVESVIAEARGDYDQ